MNPRFVNLTPSLFPPSEQSYGKTLEKTERHRRQAKPKAPAPKRRYSMQDMTTDEAASFVRLQLIDRVDAMLVPLVDELAALEFGEFVPRKIVHNGVLKIIQAVQWKLFPEEFAEPGEQHDPGVVSAQFAGQIGRARILGLVEAMKATAV